MTNNGVSLDERTRDRELRKRDWTRVYAPLIVGVVPAVVFLVAIVIVSFSPENVGGDPASVLGDTAAIILILQGLVIGVGILAILAALCALFIWLIVKVGPVLRRGQAITWQISQAVDENADLLVAQLIKPYSLSARLRAIKQFIRRPNV